jgi:hypothetical protein
VSEGPLILLLFGAFLGWRLATLERQMRELLMIARAQQASAKESSR